jgi:glycosyltransferase involved in cell wall biosynthesis
MYRLSLKQLLRLQSNVSHYNRDQSNEARPQVHAAGGFESNLARFICVRRLTAAAIDRIVIWVKSMISVCMAVFNGERYLEEQLRSILLQLASDDEVVIVDDFSSDRSVELISRMNDSRINLTRNDANLGPTPSFERAISLAKGKYIFLSDQDDIWSPCKVATVSRIFESTASLVVVSDARVVDARRNIVRESLYGLRGSRPGFWRNLYKNGFVGCCMAFRCEVKSFLLPFPARVGMHDEWIGLCSSIAGDVAFIAQHLIEYRRHETNVTHFSHGSVTSMLRKRLTLCLIVSQRLPRILAWRSQRSER